MDEEIKASVTHSLLSDQNRNGRQKHFSAILLGDFSVGKSCILTREFSNSFTDSSPTIGLDVVQRDYRIDNEAIKL